MRLSILFVFLLGVLGCNDAVVGPEPFSAGVSEAKQTENQNQPIERFLIIADGTHPDTLQRVKDYISHFVSNAPAGSVLHIVRAPDHKLVATMAVPDGNVRERLRDKILMNALAHVNAMLSDTGDVPDAFRKQLSLDRLGATYWSLRQTDHSCRITLVGTPIYYDSKQLQWAFSDLPIQKVKRYPSHSSLPHPDSTLPFRRLGRRPIPTDVQVVWLTDSNWGGDKLREDAVIHFYRHAFATQIGGELVRMSSDAVAAFESEVVSSFPELDELMDPHPPRMIEFEELPVPEPQPTPVTTNIPEPPPEVARLFEQVAADPEQTLIAINWISKYPDTDLDLWIRNEASGTELCYRNMNAPYGYLIRDVRHVGDLNGPDLIRKWEVAVLNGVEPSALTCWLDTYDSDGSAVHAKLVIILKGQQAVQEFDVTCRGDKARGAGRRETHNAWKRLDVSGRGA